MIFESHHLFSYAIPSKSQKEPGVPWLNLGYQTRTEGTWLTSPAATCFQQEAPWPLLLVARIRNINNCCCSLTNVHEHQADIKGVGKPSPSSRFFSQVIPRPFLVMQQKKSC
eukprot:TRINITY_DN56286_c0_g2_i1.p1 TRINITY_DN56286_c0_g2~~TRINITY_DN56286_c0_g2_i1.p1  ORF type:complete len:112 (-),score=16.62 TRINITY_DN56286_c0_g2_i1:271-606(-)